ncbi:MAG: lanthionine synthetase, partial [Proteobacteria bacterium]
YVDCGLAHGVAGPLAVLSLAQLQGVEVDGLAEAIAHLASWLSSIRCDDAWGVNWPYGVPLAAAASASSEPARAGWCYGSPGVGRSLYLAGRALGQRELCAIGVQGIDSALARPPHARGLSSHHLCHGHAGLMQMALRIQHEDPNENRRRAICELAESIVEHHAPGSLLGYPETGSDGRAIDEPSFLTGAPGIALALLAVACDVAPEWDCALLLS